MQNQQQAEQAASMLGISSQELDPFAMESIVSSKAKEFPPQSMVVYGVPGIGKTTFAATFERPILMRFEDGAKSMDIPTFPKVLCNLQEFEQAVSSLRTGNHDFKTLIIDSLDWFEPIVWKYVCHQHQKESIEDFGYGKGYVKVAEIWRKIQNKLDALREKRHMHIIAIAHAVAATYDPPDADSYQRYSIKLNKHGAAIWIEWSEMVLFLNYRQHIVKDENKRAKAKGDGGRVIYTTERPAYQAKRRYSLDDEIYIGNDPKWSAFHQNLKEATEGAYHHD